MVAVPRFLPERAFPPYTYVPGQAPHPIRDPAGHMHGVEPEPAELHVEDWWNCTEYLWGIDLFNHGYYWEAHEVWEGLWHPWDFFANCYKLFRSTNATCLLPKIFLHMHLSNGLFTLTRLQHPAR